MRGRIDPAVKTTALHWVLAVNTPFASVGSLVESCACDTWKDLPFFVCFFVPRWPCLLVFPVEWLTCAIAARFSPLEPDRRRSYIFSWLAQERLLIVKCLVQDLAGNHAMLTARPHNEKPNLEFASNRFSITVRLCGRLYTHYSCLNYSRTRLCLDIEPKSWGRAEPEPCNDATAFLRPFSHACWSVDW